MTAARDDVRSALITAGAAAIRRERRTITAGDELLARWVLEGVPRPLLLRFAWEGLSDEERMRMVESCADWFGLSVDAEDSGEPYTAEYWARFLDAALMTGGEDA